MIAKEKLDEAFDARFPKEVKNKLAEAKVAIAGLGGLGSNIAVMLARSGVGHLLLVDFDVVDMTNINRQMYSLEHLGLAKTEALLKIIQNINPYLDVKIKTVKITSEMVKPLFEEYPIICEAFDLPEQKAMLVGTALSQCPNSIVVAGSGMAGYGDANAIRTEKRMRRLYVCGDQSTDIGSGIGLMAPRVAICAGHQANKVLQLILEKEV